ncbi:MAG: oligosaccharide flippase family protein [Solirubrobacteraceae bacterium]
MNHADPAPASTGPAGPAATDTPDAEDPLAVGKAARRVIRGSGVRVVGNVAGLLAGLISAPLVVRHLGGVNFGHYQTVTSVVFVVAALTEGGLANVAVRAFSTASAADRRSLIANLTGLRLVMGVVGVAATVGFGLLAGYTHVVVIGLVFGAGGYFASMVQSSYSVALSGGLRLATLAGIDLLRSLTTTILLVALVVAGSALTGFFAVVLVVQLVALVVTARLVGRDVPLRPAFNRARWRMLIRETAVYALASTLGAIYFQIAMISMSILDPGPQTGYYALAFRIVEIGNGIPWLLAGSVLPVLAVAAGEPERLRYVARRVFEGATILGGLFAIAIVIGAPFAIEFLAGAKEHEAIGVLRIMGIGVTATFLVASWGFVLLALHRHRSLVLANAGALLLAIILSLTLIPSLHARGGAASTAVLELTLAGCYIALLAARGITPSIGFIARFLLALALGLGIGWLALAVHPVLGVVLGALVYLLVLWRSRAIPGELFDSLPWRR